MYLTNNQKQAMRDAFQRRHHEGFSIIEIMVAMTVMLIVVAAVFSLMGSSMKVALTTYELTDAQGNLRAAQEFINRDLINTGDGLGTLSNILVPTTFVTTYIAPVANTEVSTGVTTLGILTSDDKLSPLTDRVTIMEADPEFVFNDQKTITATVVSDSSGSKITIPGTDLMTKFQVGEIYFMTTSVGATFGSITGIAGRELNFANSSSNDSCGLNVKGNIKTVADGGATSLRRMRIIQYYVTSAKILKRRVFGVQGSGFRESTVAEHVKNLQFNYSWIETDDKGNVTGHPTTTTLTQSQQQWVRQVEVQVEVETPHAIQNGSQLPLISTTSTSVRNMQFRKAL